MIICDYRNVIFNRSYLPVFNVLVDFLFSTKRPGCWFTDGLRNLFDDTLLLLLIMNISYTLSKWSNMLEIIILVAIYCLIVHFYCLSSKFDIFDEFSINACSRFALWKLSRSTANTNASPTESPRQKINKYNMCLSQLSAMLTRSTTKELNH